MTASAGSEASEHPKKYLFNLKCISVLPEYTYAYHACCARGGQRALGFQKQELQAAVTHHTDAGN